MDAKSVGDRASEAGTDAGDARDLVAGASADAGDAKPSYNQHVAEYIGHLWFVKTNGIKFRETIKVLSISPSGESSTVECSTEYYNGSTWVHCSRIVCVFHSIPIQKLEDDNVQDRELGVKMALDCELLVWLPLPGAASRAVKRQIGSVFESAARAFLMGIRKASW